MNVNMHYYAESEVRSSLPPPGPDLDTFNLAKSYFDLKEYDRAAFFTKSLTFQHGKSSNAKKKVK